MAGNKLKAELASAADFELLPMWYDLAGVICNDPEKEVRAYQAALQAGYLGAPRSSRHLG